MLRARLQTLLKANGTACGLFASLKPTPASLEHFAFIQVVSTAIFSLQSSRDLVGFLLDLRQLKEPIDDAELGVCNSMYSTRSTAFQIPVVVHANLDRPPTRAKIFHRYPAIKEAVIQAAIAGPFCREFARD